MCFYKLFCVIGSNFCLGLLNVILSIFLERSRSTGSIWWGWKENKQKRSSSIWRLPGYSFILETWIMAFEITHLQCVCMNVDITIQLLVRIVVICRHMGSARKLCLLMISGSNISLRLWRGDSVFLCFGVPLLFGGSSLQIAFSMYLAAGTCCGRCYDSEQMRRFRLLSFFCLFFFFLFHKWLAPRHVLTGEISFQIRMWTWRLSKATNCRNFSAWLKEEKKKKYSACWWLSVVGGIAAV